MLCLAIIESIRRNSAPQIWNHGFTRITAQCVQRFYTSSDRPYGCRIYHEIVGLRWKSGYLNRITLNVVMLLSSIAAKTSAKFGRTWSIQARCCEMWRGVLLANDTVFMTSCGKLAMNCVKISIAHKLFERQLRDVVINFYLCRNICSNNALSICWMCLAYVTLGAGHQ